MPTPAPPGPMPTPPPPAPPTPAVPTPAGEQLWNCKLAAGVPTCGLDPIAGKPMTKAICEAHCHFEQSTK
jgi:hypothetical protein